jgi:hypothetical protein
MPEEVVIEPLGDESPDVIPEGNTLFIPLDLELFSKILETMQATQEIIESLMVISGSPID